MVTAFVDGVPKTVMVQGNPRAAQGINGLLNAEVEKDARMRAFQKVNHFLAGAFTSYNPAFIFTNLSRDMVFANQAAYVKEGGAYWRAFTGNQGKVLAQIGGAMGRYTHNRLKPTAFDRYLAEFIDNGGETGYINIHRTEEFKKSILKDVKRLDGGAVNAVKVGAKAIGDWVEFGNRCAEDVNRLAAYITSREMGRSVQQSIDDAKNITVNFNRRGAGNQTDTFWGKWVMPWLTSQYLFVNAGIQSLANVSKMTVKHPARAALVLASLTAMGALVPWLNQVLQALLGTPDGQDDPYGDLPDWIRRNNLCLYIGGGKFITIPLPIELRALYGLGELGYQVYTGGEAKGDIALDVLSQFSQLLPLNVLEGGTDSDGWGERLFMTITPDYAKPFVEAWMNRDWTGKPLYKKTPWNEKAPEWTKAYKGTSKWLVSSAKMLSESTGGDDYKKGDVDINPALVEHFYNGFTGGAGKTLMQVVNLWQLSDKDYRNARNIPVLNRFLTQSDERTAFSQTRRLYYDYLDDVKELKRLDSAYNNDDRYAKKAEALERSPEWKLYEGNEDDIDDIRDLQDELKDNETDLMEQARIQVEINRLMKRVVGRNKAFERAN